MKVYVVFVEHWSWNEGLILALPEKVFTDRKLAEEFSKKLYVSLNKERGMCSQEFIPKVEEVELVDGKEEDHGT